MAIKFVEQAIRVTANNFFNDGLTVANEQQRCTSVNSFITFVNHFLERIINRGTYMSAHVLLNLLNKLGKR